MVANDGLRLGSTVVANDGLRLGGAVIANDGFRLGSAVIADVDAGRLRLRLGLRLRLVRRGRCVPGRGHAPAGAAIKAIPAASAATASFDLVLEVGMGVTFSSNRLLKN